MNVSQENKPQKNDVAKAVAWKFAERVGVNGITFILSLILARLLTPNDYGTLALLNIFIQVSATLIDGGFYHALIQKNDCDSLDYSSVFWFSFIFSIVCYFILFFSAPLIARFYNQQILIKVLRVSAVSLIIRVFQSVPSAVVNKKINFRITTNIFLISNVASGMLAIILAYKGVGLWALVVQHLSASIITSILFILFTKWHPSLSFSISRIKKLLGFGLRMMLLVFCGSVFDNLYGIIIGKKYSNSALGVYNRGEAFPKLIVTNVSGAIENVVFPTLTYYTEDKEKALAIVRRFVTLSTYCVMPIVFGMMAVAKPMIIVLLTDKWIESVFFLRIACIVYAFNPLRGASFSSLYAFGRSDIALRFTIIRYALIILSLIVSMSFGLRAMAVAYAIASVVSIFLDMFPCNKLLNYKFGYIVLDILPAFLLSLLMFVLVYPISFFPLNSIAILILQMFVGFISYIIFSKIFKNNSYEYIITTIKGCIGSKKKRNEK